MLTYAESDKAQANTAQNRIFHKYLRENELLSKTNLAYLLGAQMVSIHEIKKSCDTAPFKGVCHKIFDLHFLWFEPIWAPDEQVFSNSVSILPIYSITKFEKFNSAVCMTP